MMLDSPENNTEAGKQKRSDPVQADVVLPERITQTETISNFLRNSKNITTVEYEAGTELPEALLVEFGGFERIVAPAGYHPVAAELYPEDGRYRRTKEWFYDESGRCIQETSTYTSSGSDSEDISTKTFTTDLNGKFVSWSKTDNSSSDGELYTTEGGYRYDENGNLIEITVKSMTGELFRKQAFTYNQNGRLEQLSWIDNIQYAGADESVEEIFVVDVYEYDEQGRLVRRTSPSNGYYDLYSYDENNRVVKHSRYNPGGSLIIEGVFDYK